MCVWYVQKWCQLFTGEFITYCRFLCSSSSIQRISLFIFHFGFQFNKCVAKDLSLFLTKWPHLMSYISAPQRVVAVYCTWWNCVKCTLERHNITFSYLKFQCLWITQNFQAFSQLTTFRLHILQPTREVSLFGLEKEFVENDKTKANLYEITTTLDPCKTIIKLKTYRYQCLNTSTSTYFVNLKLEIFSMK